MLEGRGSEDHRAAVEAALDRLRSEFVEKHQANQADIRELRDGQSELRGDLQELSGKIDPYLDNGQPGLFSRMAEKQDAMLSQLGDLKVAKAKEDGRRDVYAWLRAIIGPLIVGLVLILCQHAWK